MKYIPKFLLLDKKTGAKYPVDVLEYPLTGAGVVVTTYINDMERLTFNIRKDDEESPYELLQYLGIKDREGVEVYESYEVKIDDLGIFVIDSLETWYKLKKEYKIHSGNILVVNQI